MYLKNSLLLVVFFILMTCSTGFLMEQEGSNKPRFKHFGQIAYFFETKEALTDFFDLRKHEVVAEIGAGDGLNSLDLTLLADSVTFYLQDIDSLTLDGNTFDGICRRAARLKKPQTNQYIRIIGTSETTNLSDNSVDKVILVMTFHEFEFMQEMLSDIYAKLKPSGKLYVLEARCFRDDHRYYDREEAVDVVESAHFRLERIDGKDYYRSKDLYRAIFVKTEKD